MNQRAPFIVLEGPEGAGKSVQARGLADWLMQEGWEVVLTREPGGTLAGDAIRTILLQSDHLGLRPRTEALLMSAARAQHVEEVIRPALLLGKIVISDRYVDSTYAYQGAGHQLPASELVAVQHFATDGLQPDIRLLLDLPVEMGLSRRHGDADQVNRIDLAPLEFHQRVRAGYLDLVQANPSAWDVIDARATMDKVAHDIRATVERRLTSWETTSRGTEAQ